MDPWQQRVLEYFSIAIICFACIQIITTGCVWLKTRNIEEFSKRPKMILGLSTLAMVTMIGYQILYFQNVQDRLNTTAQILNGIESLLFFGV